MKKAVKKEKKPKTIKAVKKVKKVKKKGKKKAIITEEKTIKKEKGQIMKKKEEETDKNIQKINKILKDGKKEEENEFDLLFLIDATGSMDPYIDAARNETENISKELRKLYPEMNFQYGYVFYRDPVDSKEDKHEIINLTDNVNSLPSKIKKIKAIGGGDLPEDWVGAYKKANEEISWRNGKRVIIHLADAGAHGKEFTPSDKYRDEGEKLMYELDRCFEKKIKIFGYVLAEDSRNSFNVCQKIYRKMGGEYEICNFILQNENYYKRDDLAKYKGKSLCMKKRKYDLFEKEESEDNDEKTLNYQDELNAKFKTRVLTSVKSVIKK